MARKQANRVKAGRRALVAGAADDRRPELEAITVLLAPAGGQSTAGAAARLVRRLALKGWTIDVVAEGDGEVELVPGRRVAIPRAWDLTYALRDEPDVVHAEPMFRYLVPENAGLPAGAVAFGPDVHDPATATDFEWSLRRTRVLEAWRLFGSRPPGADVRVGHPDTGYTLHPELADPGRVLVGAGFDFDDDDPDPVDDMDDGFLDNPGHGTATGSVILSGIGSATGGSGPFVSGAAPHASLIPIRTNESVVLFSMRALRRAIDHAVSQGAHVISISMGGPQPGFGTRRAVRRAVEAGTTVLAAAGNEIGFVVFPAAFDEVIAVAASNVHDEPWRGSSRGPAVDITAPGESVWRAKPETRPDGGLTFLVERGNGTSFAVATTAGVAALWVSFHGWSTLVRRFGPAGVPRVFKQLLQATCRTPRGWDTKNFGPGIVNAEGLLAEPLPALAAVPKLRDVSRPSVAADTTGIETLVHLLPDVSRVRVETMASSLLHVPDRALPERLQEVGDELVFQLVMHPSLIQSWNEGASSARAASVAPPGVARTLGRAGVSRRLRKTLAGG